MSPPTSPPTPRTNAALVGGIVQVQDGVDITPFIAIANELTTDLCTYDPTLPPFIQPYTDGFVGSKMELIERWLAAHFYTIFDSQLTFAKAGTVSVAYQYKVNYGLANSMYGQQAMILDALGGNLSKYDNSAKTKRKIKVSMGWLGRHHCGEEFVGDEITVVQ